MNNRIKFFDLAKGICIILVVLFHLDMYVGMNEQCATVLSSFRMPLYFVLSGVFFKAYPFKEFLRRKTNKLLIPFFFFYITTAVILPYILICLFDINFNVSCDWSMFYSFIVPEKFPNIPIWFLWALFLANVLFYALCRVFRSRDGRILYIPLFALSAVLMYAMEYAIYKKDINLPAFIDNVLLFFPFFCLGASCRTHLIKLENITLRTKLLLLAVSAVLTIASALYVTDNTTVLLKVILRIVSGFSGSVAVFSLAAVFGHLPVISYFGRYSIIILVSHGVIIKMLKVLSGHPYSGNTVMFNCMIVALVFIILYITIPLMKKYIPWFVAQKDLL